MPFENVPAPDLREYEHGLVASANRPDTSVFRWENGVGVSFKGHIVINGMCSTCDEPGTKSAEQTCADGVVFFPYLLEFGIQERVNGGDPISEIAERLMVVGSSARLEDLQVVGCTGTDNPVLEDGTSLGSGEPTVALGLMVKEFYNADNHIGAQGTIYMSPVVAAELGFDLLTIGDDGLLRTKFGRHKVIVGNYPNGKMFGHIGDVDVYLSDVFTYEAAISVRTNNIERYRVERMGLVVWDTTQTFEVTVT